MFNKFYVRQLDETDCGAASLSMICKYYHSKISISTLRNYAQTDERGTSALGLTKAAQHFHLETHTYQTDYNYLMNHLENFTSPFIAHFDKKNGMLHYVVVFKIFKNYILIADPDPACGLKKMSYDDFKNNWTGIVMLFSPNSHYSPITENRDSLWRLGRYLLRHKTDISKIVLLTFCASAITIASAFFLQQIIDSFVPNKEYFQLKIITVGLAFSYTFYGVFSYLEVHYSTNLAKKMGADILLPYIHHLFSLPFLFFHTRKTGELISRLSDASNIINTLSVTVITAILNLGTLLVMGITLIAINPRLLLLSLIVIPVYVLLIALFLTPFDKLNKERMERNSELNSELIEDLHGIESIKSMGIEAIRFDKIKKHFTYLLDIGVKYGNYSGFQSSLKDMSRLLVNLLVLYIGGKMAISGQMRVGELIAFNALSAYFLNPIEELLGLQNQLQTAKVANARMNQVLFAKSEVSCGKKTLMLQENSVLRMNNVSFEYKYGQKVVNNLSFSIEVGQPTAIVGLSGSGKTTIAKLLSGFYRPGQGSVTIDECDLSEFSKESRSSNIIYLPQTPYIFSGSILDNILLGTSSAENPEKTASDAAKMAEIDADISKLPDAYDTVLSENSGLSGGQLQRIAIARAIACSASVIIMDESTSNLDILTETRIFNNLMSLHNKTLIFIVHRLEIAKKLDNIILIKQGQVIERGSHKELMDRQGAYYRLWQEMK